MEWRVCEDCCLREWDGGDGGSCGVGMEFEGEGGWVVNTGEGGMGLLIVSSRLRCNGNTCHVCVYL